MRRLDGTILASEPHTIYGYHMSDTIKTTVYLDGDDYRRLQALARAEGGSAAQLVREAVAEYVRSHHREVAPTSIGVARSASGTVGERAEDLLADGFGQ